MRKSELTLEKVRGLPKASPVREYRTSDFLTTEQLSELHQNNAKPAQKRKKFDAVDSYIAEIMARFGYEAFKAWNMGEISDRKMRRLLEAERAREKQVLLGLEGIILMANAASARGKKGQVPKPLKAASKIYRNEEKIAKGVL